MQINAQFIRRIWSHNKTLDSLKVALGFSGVLVFCFGLDHKHWLIGLILGVIAAALAETRDRFWGRLKALLVTLICFSLVAFSVRLLFPYPWLFSFGFAIASFFFVMLGALGERYAAITTASVILAIYTMLGISQHTGNNAHFWQEPVLLLAGAAWYGCISLLAVALFRDQPVRQMVARVFEALSSYLDTKADLLEPVQGKDLNALRITLATQNGLLVGIMNMARSILVQWTQSRRPAEGSRRFLLWYFLAQDVHERASSAHYPYGALSEAFARSDVLFRCQRLLKLQAKTCLQISEAIAQGEAFHYPAEGARALDEVKAALAEIQYEDKQSAVLISSLADLCRNISGIEASLARAERPEELAELVDSNLRDSEPRNLSEMWSSFKQQFTPASRRFRHALRLSSALFLGYGLLHLLNLPQGYWVMLTTVFVCQPNFSSTWTRLGQRLSGTVAGLVLTSLFISAFPHPLAQLALLLVVGVVFFATRAERYALATGCITALVLLCFNQFGSSYALIWPRLLDTLLGGLLAVGAVTFILPDWQSRRLHQSMAHTLNAISAYLNETLHQYHGGKNDDIAYRIARRDAHNADAELSSTLTNMLLEPGRYKLAPEIAYQFLCSSHTLLGYVSALGAHREQVIEWRHEEVIRTQVQRIQTRLTHIATALANHDHVSTETAPLSVLPKAELFPNDAEDIEHRIMRQCTLIESHLPELANLANEFPR